MGDDLQYLDIVLLALIAGFIVLRLRGTLGKRTGFDGTPGAEPSKRTPEDAQETILRLPRPQPPAPTMEEMLEQVSPAARAGIERIIAHEEDFSVPEFLAGAKAAFEMVIEAFNKEESAALGPLLSPEVKQAFDEAFATRKREGRYPETTLVAIAGQKITEATLIGSQARISVLFTTEQINLVRDVDGKLLEGDPSQVDNVPVEWTFERTLSSRNPNWTITAT